MDKKETPLIIICSPVKGFNKDYLVPGSVQEKCVDCGQMFWVSPSGVRQLHSHPGAIVKCISCAMPEVKKASPGDIAPISEEQKAEIRAILSKNKKNPLEDNLT